MENMKYSGSTLNTKLEVLRKDIEKYDDERVEPPLFLKTLAKHYVAILSTCVLGVVIACLVSLLKG